MHLQDPYINIPTLKIGSEKVTKNQDKAKAFLEAFFSKIADTEEETIIPHQEEIK